MNWEDTLLRRSIEAELHGISQQCFGPDASDYEYVIAQVCLREDYLNSQLELLDGERSSDIGGYDE